MLLAVGAMGCSGDYKPTICTAVNINLLDCVPTDPSKKRFDLKTNSPDFIGYACFSEEDFSEGKRRARQILEGVD